MEIGCEREADGAIRLTWAEMAGPPLAGAPEKQGFGTRLLRRALAKDLGPGAQVDLRFEPEGLIARIGFWPKG